ncbi:MAG: hypothetical protein IPG92_16465 [Flavobacteriales bacterium]|nr:hypothetical protein [Flavobacteriales bacterium]
MPPADQQKPVAAPLRSRWKRRLLRVLVWVVLLPPVLIALVILLVYLPPIQEFVRSKAVGILEEKIGTPVRLERFALRFPAGVALDGLLVLDHRGDTMLYAGELKSNLSLSSLMEGRIELRGSRLAHVRAVMDQRADSTFNFTYIIEAFTGDKVKEATADTTAPMRFSMTGVVLEDVNFDMTMARSGLGMRVRLGKLDVAMDAMDATATLFHVSEITLANTRVAMRTAPRAPEPDTYPELPNPFEGLDITLKELGLENVSFSLANTTTGDSLWLSIEKGDVQVDSVELARQRMHFGSLALEGARFGTVSRKDTARDTTREASPAWLDQNDGFRYWARGLDVSLRDLTIVDGEFQLHQGSAGKTAQLFDPLHTSFTNIAITAENILFNDQRIAAVIKRISATGANGTELHAALRMSATPSEIHLDDGLVALSGTEVRFSATALLGDLTTAYRTPKAVPLSARIRSNIDLSTLPALLHQVGVTLPKTINAHETLDTRIAFSGTAQRADTVRVDVIGDQGTIVHLTGQAQDIANVPESSFRADLREINMGDGLCEIVRAYVPSNVPMPARFAGTAFITGGGNAMTADLDLRSDLGDVKGKLDAAGLSARMPNALHVDLTITNAAIHRFVADTAMGPLSVHILAAGQALNTARRSGSLEIAPNNGASTDRIWADRASVDSWKETRSMAT